MPKSRLPVRYLFLFLLTTGLTDALNAQCDTGSEPECQCATAEVYCTIDSLDGFQLSMSDFQHPEDAPDPLCDDPTCLCLPDNPHWFAFQAWCTDIDIAIYLDTCYSFMGGQMGAQAAVYSNCAVYNEVDCDAVFTSCGNDTKMLNLTGLVLGQTYYLMIDGCTGSYCDLTIDVLGVCGGPPTENWTDSLSGIQDLCVGETASYSIDALDGNFTYYWFVDGTEVATTANPSTDITFPASGQYQVCVDAEEEPCSPLNGEPDPACKMVNVVDPAGAVISATPETLCPGQSSAISVGNYQADSLLSQYLVVTDSNDLVIDVIQGLNYQLGSTVCGVFTAYNLVFFEGEDISIPSVGEIFQPGICAGQCCDLISTQVSFEDTQDPVFLSPPPDVAVSCIYSIPLPNGLEVQDNCTGNAVALPEDLGVVDSCSGGVLTRIWEYSDSCGNQIVHNQQITVGEIEEAFFLNPPTDTVVGCNERPTVFPELDYDNAAIDPLCRIAGSALPVVEDNPGSCSDTIFVSWSFTDLCGRTLSHTQRITVEAAAPPDFIDLPADSVIDCNAGVPPADSLVFSNGQEGDCEWSGSVPAESDSNEIGPLYRWSLVRPCVGDTLVHEQQFSCTETCRISAEVVSTLCDAAGTPADSSDDHWTVIFNVDAINAGSPGWQTGSGLQGDYGDSVEIGPIPIFFGDTAFIIADLEDPECLDTLVLTPPDPCSSPCEVNFSSDILPCNDNNTGSDTTDDYFDLWVFADTLSTPASQYIVVVSGQDTVGPVNYGDSIRIQGLPASDSILQVKAMDIQAAHCRDSFEVSQSPCSSCDFELAASGNGTLSCDRPEVVLTAVAPGAIELEWEGPNGYIANGDSVAVDLAGIYILIGTFEGNCIVKDTITIEADMQIPEAMGGEDGLLNCAVDSYLLRNLSNADSSVISQWLDASGNILSNEDVYAVGDSGSYFLRLIDTLNSCTSALDIVVVREDLHKPTAVITASPDTAFGCEQLTIELSAGLASNAVFEWEYNGQNVAGDVFNAMDPGMYQLLARDTISECRDTSSILLEDASDLPRLSIAPPDTINCTNTEAVLFVSQPSVPLSFEWRDIEGQPLAGDTNRITVSRSGAYIVQWTDTSSGCFDTDTVMVIADSSRYRLGISGETELPCGKDSTTLFVADSNALALEGVEWESNTGLIENQLDSATVLVRGPGLYTVSAVHPSSGCISRNSVFVNTTEDIEIIDLSIDSIECEGEPGALTVNVLSGTPPFDIQLDSMPIEAGERVDLLAPGIYLLTISDANGCMLERVVNLTEGRSVEIDLIPVLELAVGDTALIQAMVNLNEQEIDTVIWRPDDQLSCANCLQTMVTAVDDREYQLGVIDTAGCKAYASLQILVLQESLQIYIPNAFSPNGNGINDRFTVYSGTDLLIDRIQIYDRWGNRIWERRDLPANDPGLGWDGRAESGKMDPGVYTYLIEYKLPDGERRTRSGELYLLN